VVAPRYIALSHCWGGDVAGKLTTKNYDSLRISESPQSLPQNFIDAIKITRGMGLRFCGSTRSASSRTHRATGLTSRR
jgi:hypothetical protein